MSSDNKKKKLKMERLSPIPSLNPSRHLPNLLNTPVQRVVTQQKDVYAIEITSSPEFIQPPFVAGSSSLKKQRRIRNIARCKVPKKNNSTPLSGLIIRKTVDKADNDIHFPDQFNSPTLTDLPSPGEAQLWSIPEEVPHIEDNSPQKSSHSPRNSEMISASAIFFQGSQPSTSNTSSLAGIVIKETSNLHHSLNDSLLVLREAEDPSDDDEVTSSTSLVNVAETNSEKVSIETFESPRKPRYMMLKEHTTAASIFKNFNSHSSKNFISDKPDEVSRITVNSSLNSVEICGKERKNRKRALDFNSPNCMVLTESDDLGDARRSPILNLMSSRHDLENPQSPVLNLSPFDHETDGDQHSPILNFMSPRLDRSDCESPALSLKPQKSPILDLLPPGHYEENNSKSPVLDLMTLGHESKGDHKSPTLNIKSPAHDLDFQSSVLNLKPTESENPNPMAFCSSNAHFKPLKPLKYQEFKPHVEKQDEECLSDPTTNIGHSTIENRNHNSGGLNVPSLNIENDSLSSIGKADHSDDDFDIPRIVEILEDTPTTKSNKEFDLKFVVSHDTSSDESVLDPDEKQITENSGDVIFPSIDGRHSPLDLNYTKRPIRSFDSPFKVPKPFSEALNIGAFGSPDSNASYEDQQDENRFGTDEVIEPSTTQEYVEESEQVRPTKRRKKGSFLERVKSVKAKVDASNTLFNYEIKCGLRQHEGKFVSAPMVILKESLGSASLFLICKPLKYCGKTHVEDISSYVIVHVNKLPSGICEGSVVRLHFPVNVIYLSNLHIPCVLAGHQIVMDPTKQKIDIRTIDASSLESINSTSLAYNKPMTAFRTISSIQLRTLSEAALCQNLVEETHLYLTVLHVTELYVEAIVKKTSALCCDEEYQFCWLEFSSEHDIKRAVALKSLHILSDGSLVQTKGFSVTNRVRLDRKSKHLVSYCLNNTVNNEIIFSVHPNEPDWVISSTVGLREVNKVRSSIEDILSKKILGCRYLLEVHGIEKESPIKLKDYRGQSIHFVVGENTYLKLDHPVPFLLDGLYFFDDKLFSDEHTRVIPII